MKKMQEKNKILFIKLVLPILLVLLSIITGEGNYLFLANVILSIIILFKTKISFFSLKTVLILYTLIPFFAYYQFGYAYGIFRFTDISYYREANSIILIYNTIWYFLLEKTDLLLKEKELLKIKFELSKVVCNIFATLAIIFAIIRLPSLPFAGVYDERFISLLPGNSWNHLTIIALLFTLPKLKTNHYVQFSYVFVIIWFLGHGERVDIAGLFAMLVVYFFTNKKVNWNTKNISIILAIGIAVFTSFVFIENVRMGYKFKIESIFTKVFVPSTASDVSYVYHCAIDYKNEKSLLLGQSYLSYIVEAIPTVEYKHNIDNIINRNYYTVGGNFILNEPYMNFGYLGIFLFSGIEFLVLYFIFNKNKEYNFLIYSIIMVSVFRIVWYGISYIEVTALVVVPVFYFFKMFIDKKMTNKDDGEVHE